MKKTRAELMKDVDAQYYGFRDDDDGLLVRLDQVGQYPGKKSKT